MSLYRCIGWSLAIGAAIPILWLLLNWAILIDAPDLSHTVMSALYFDRVLIVLWPSWIFLIADPENQSVLVPLVSVASNSALYGVIGWLTWMGLHRNKSFLGLVALLLIGGWYSILSWYLA